MIRMIEGNMQLNMLENVTNSAPNELKMNYLQVFLSFKIKIEANFGYFSDIKISKKCKILHSTVLCVRS